MSGGTLQYSKAVSGGALYMSHPCQVVCPKDAIYLDAQKHSHIDQSKCIKCGKCVNQCPYHAITKIERPCAAACGMDAIESDEKGRAKINYDKCVSCGMVAQKVISGYEDGAFRPNQSITRGQMAKILYNLL